MGYVDINVECKSALKIRWYVRLAVFTAVTMQKGVVWDVIVVGYAHLHNLSSFTFENNKSKSLICAIKCDRLRPRNFR
jgi:hypothetical protein